MRFQLICNISHTAWSAALSAHASLQRLLNRKYKDEETAGCMGDASRPPPGLASTKVDVRRLTTTDAISQNRNLSSHGHGATRHDHLKRRETYLQCLFVHVDLIQEGRKPIDPPSQRIVNFQNSSRLSVPEDRQTTSL